LECGDLTPLSLLLSLDIRRQMKKEGKKESGVKPPHSKMTLCRNGSTPWHIR